MKLPPEVAQEAVEMPKLERAAVAVGDDRLAMTLSAAGVAAPRTRAMRSMAATGAPRQSIRWPVARPPPVTRLHHPGVIEALFGFGFGHEPGGIGRVAYHVGRFADLPHRLFQGIFNSDWKPLPILLQLGVGLAELPIASGSFSGPSTTSASTRITMISLPGG